VPARQPILLRDFMVSELMSAINQQKGASREGSSRRKPDPQFRRHGIRCCDTARGFVRSTVTFRDDQRPRAVLPVFADQQSDARSRGSQASDTKRSCYARRAFSCSILTARLRKSA
jgi:hypothetical protein